MVHRDEQAQVAAVVGLLEDWADWQKGFRLKLGYPTKSAGLSGTGSSTFDEMCDASDNETMQKVDACVEDLQPIHRAAVLRRYGVAAVFRFPRANYEEMLLAAHMELIVSMRRKGVVA